MSLDATTAPSDSRSAMERYAGVRRFTEQLCEPLSAEDCAIQSMPDVSPTRWHLAHTTWFFETFLLSLQSDYRVYDPEYAYLFNSYYNTIGKQYPRPQRGLLSRPGLDEILSYRRYVDEHMLELLRTPDAISDRIAAVLDIGLHHEQQHQELIITDIKHVFSSNPSLPVYRDGAFVETGGAVSPEWLGYDEGIYWIGHGEDTFAFDNESPRHRVFLESFKLSCRLVTCGEYLRFMEDGGYERPELWLSLGWQTAREHAWDAPLYWYRHDGKWYQ